MGKIKRGGFIFIIWKGDHGPRHVHVFKDGRAVLKWNLEDNVPMKGKPTKKIINLIVELIEEGKL